MVHTRDELANYGETVAEGHREDIPEHWPEELRTLISDCWAEDPRERPAFSKVIARLTSIRDSGVAHQVCDPSESQYSMFCDCGCSLQ